MSKKIKTVTGIAILIFLSLFLIFFFSNTALKENLLPIINLPSGNPEIVETILEIDGKVYQSEIIGQISVYNFMNKFRNEGKINFTEKNYTGIGKFIVAINGVKGNGDQNWIYYVNGKEAQVGVSNYKINPGDVVSWKYESQY